MLQELKNGNALWRILDAVHMFRSHAVGMIRLGEESGRLAENLTLVAERERKDREFNAKLTGAMAYPLFVLFVTGVVGVGVAWFILPRLAVVFGQLRIDLPAITRVILNFGTFLATYGTVAVPTFLGVSSLLIYFLFFFRGTRFIGQAMFLAIPAFRRFIQDIELARLGFVFGTMLDAGLPVLQVIDSLTDSTRMAAYQKLYRSLHEAIARGESLQEGMHHYRRSGRLIPGPIQQLIGSAERSGGLSGTLARIGQIYDSRSEIAMKNIATLVEPVLLVIVWLGVVAVAMAVILPLYSLVGQLKH
jgi:type II secretory pathway component PulF